MTRVYSYAFGALVAAAGAYLTAPKGGMEFWLFAIAPPALRSRRPDSISASRSSPEERAMRHGR